MEYHHIVILRDSLGTNNHMNSQNNVIR